MSDSPSSSMKSALPPITLNPLIKYIHYNHITTLRPPPLVVPNQTVPIQWDIREKPTTETVRHLTNDPDVTLPLHESELGESATNPPVEALHITCGLFEENWTIWAIGAHTSPPSSPSGSSASQGRLGGIGMTVFDEHQRRVHHRLSSGSYGGYPSSPSSGGTPWSNRRTSFGSHGSSSFNGGGRGVTVLEVLQAIHLCMNTPLQQDEWDRMSKKHQDRVNLHFDSRWRKAKNQQETRAQGVLRGDCLLHSHVFAGLEVLYTEGQPTSPGSTIPDGHVRFGGAVTGRCILVVHRPTSRPG